MSNVIDKLLLKKGLEKKVLYFYKNFKEVSSLTIAELLEKALFIAQDIKNREITNKNIIISLENEEAFVTYFFGVLISGNTPVPMASSALMLKEDYKELLGQFSTTAETKIIVAKSSVEGFKNIYGVEFEGEAPSIDNFPTLNPKDACFIQFSSGSTSAPKGVVVTHENLIANHMQINDGLGLTKSDSICTWLPLHHDMGLIGSLMTALLNGLECHVVRTQDYVIAPHKWLHLVADTKSTVLCIPNSAYYVCANKIPDKALEGLDLSRIRIALCGAEPIKGHVLEGFNKRFKRYGFSTNAIMPVYGLAEATLAVAFHKFESSFETTIIGAQEHVSCGKVLAPTIVEIRGQDGNILADKEIGEIYIKGPSISTNYYGRESHLEEGWLNTGDLGFLNEEKLYITGRSKDLLIINGVNIYANDVEFYATKQPQVKLGRIVAFSYQNDKSETPHIVLELNLASKKARAQVKNEIAQALRSKLALSEENISIVPELTLKKTTSGKVKRQHAKNRYLTGEISKIESRYALYSLLSSYKKNMFKISFIIKEKLSSRNANG